MGHPSRRICPKSRGHPLHPEQRIHSSAGPGAHCGPAPAPYPPPARRSLRIERQTPTDAITVTAVELPARLAIDTDLVNAARIEGALTEVSALYLDHPTGRPGQATGLRAAVTIPQTPAVLDLTTTAGTGAAPIGTVHLRASEPFSVRVNLRNPAGLVAGLRRARINAELPGQLDVDVTNLLTAQQGTLSLTAAARRPIDADLPVLAAEIGARVILFRPPGQQAVIEGAVLKAPHVQSAGWHVDQQPAPQLGITFGARDSPTADLWVEVERWPSRPVRSTRTPITSSQASTRTVIPRLWPGAAREPSNPPGVPP